MDAFRINVFISLTSWPSSVLSSKYLADGDKYGASATYLLHSSTDIHGTRRIQSFYIILAEPINRYEVTFTVAIDHTLRGSCERRNLSLSNNAVPH